MVKEDTISRIQTELTALKTKATELDWKYRFTYHSGTSTFDMLDSMERVRKRKVELEDALRVMEEFK